LKYFFNKVISLKSEKAVTKQKRMTDATSDMLMRKLQYYVNMALAAPEKSAERIYRIHILFQYCMTDEGAPVLTSEKYTRFRGQMLDRIAEFEKDPIAKPYRHFRHGMTVLKATLLGQPLRRSPRHRLQADHEKFSTAEPVPQDPAPRKCQCFYCTYPEKNVPIKVKVLPRRSARLMKV
jgi:hypothetical protein